MPGLILDLSSNNPHPIDFKAVAASGVSAVIVKATEGTGYTNPYYAEDMAGARAAGLQVAAYHFASFGDVAAEAAYFKSVAGADAKVLDIEMSTDTAWMNAFRANLPSVSMLYGSGSSLPRTIYPLNWEASYGAPAPMGLCQLWQFTDAQTVGGIGAPADASKWMGTDAQYNAFFGISTTTAPAATGEREMATATTTFGNLTHVFYVDGGGTLHHAFQHIDAPLSPKSAWGEDAFKPGGLQPHATPDVEADSKFIHVYVRGNDDKIHHFYQTLGATTWGQEVLP
jgi:Glycosyl hydrolases family 25